MARDEAVVTWQALADMERRGRAGYMPATSLAAVRSALGDRQGALDPLERGYRERDVRMSFCKIDGRWNTLRGEPRFQAIARRMHLD